MKKDWAPTKDAFDHLLKWLDPDRENAGRKYEEIRSRLIRIFARRGCPVGEELADETIDRVTRKALEVSAAYVGDPCSYFYGVAQNVFLEYVKGQQPPKRSPPPKTDVESAEEKERRLDCLDVCVQNLDPESRDLILEYFRDEKRAKIDHRKELAARLGVALNTLRMRAYRIKITLQQCVGQCLDHRQPS